MHSLPLQLHTYRHENLIHAFISVLTFHSSYTSSSNTKLSRTEEITHWNDHETQKIAYFLIRSPNFSLPLTSHRTQYSLTHFKHFFLPVLRKTSHSEISTLIGRSPYQRLLSVADCNTVHLNTWILVYGTEQRTSWSCHLPPSNVTEATLHHLLPQFTLVQTWHGEYTHTLVANKPNSSTSTSLTPRHHIQQYWPNWTNNNRSKNVIISLVKHKIENVKVFFFCNSD